MNKKILIMRSMLALCLMTGALASCDKDEDKIVVTASSLATPKVSTTTVAIDPEQLSATALTLTWDKVNFTPSGILAKNDIVISVEGKTPIIFPVGESTSHSFTAQALNEILIEQFKLTPGKATPVLFTVRTYPNNGNTPAQPSGSSLAVSQPVTVTITPAAVVTETPNFYFVGKGLGSTEWNVGYNGYPFFKNTADAKEYTYTGLFQANTEFKLVSETGLGDWSKAYGLDGTKIAENKGGNINSISAAGYYTIVINPTTGSISVEPYATGATADTYNKISVIGSTVGGWDVANDVLLEKSSYDPHIWFKGNVELKTGELKFRANQSWDKNWGGQKNSFPAGVSNSGDNIQVPAKYAGTYDVFFNDLTSHYLFRKVNK